MAKVRIYGAQCDILARLFPTRPGIQREVDDYFLEADEIDAAIDADPPDDPLTVARRLLALMNVVGQSQFIDFIPARLGDQTTDWVGWTPEPSIRVAYIVGYTGPPPDWTPNENIGRKLFEAAAACRAADDALHFLSRSNGQADWFDLYKVFELLRDNAGMGWMTARSSRRKLNDFTMSADHPAITGRAARHAVQTNTPGHVHGSGV